MFYLVTQLNNLYVTYYDSDNCNDCPSQGFVPMDDRISLQLRRTTFVVYNMTRSLQFYRDGLGMVPIYGKLVTMTRNIYWTKF